MACIIFGAGSYYGLTRRPEPGDYIIAADGGTVVEVNSSGYGGGLTPLLKPDGTPVVTPLSPEYDK